MANHVTTVAICQPDYERGEFDVATFNEQHKDTNICAMLKPQPPELDDPKRPKVLTTSALAWQRTNWGCKWGTYDMVAHKLPGDCQAVVIAFCSPWNPPYPMLDAIAEWIKRECFMASVTWLVCDPYDSSTRLLETENA